MIRRIVGQDCVLCARWSCNHKTKPLLLLARDLQEDKLTRLWYHRRVLNNGENDRQDDHAAHSAAQHVQEAQSQSATTSCHASARYSDRTVNVPLMNERRGSLALPFAVTVGAVCSDTN